MLTEEHKIKQQANALTLLTQYSEQSDDFLSRTVIGDETWASHITPESKQQSMERRHTTSPIKNKFKQTISSRKTTRTVFWDRKRILLLEFLPQGSTINARVYYDTLKKLRRAIQNKQCGMLSQGVVMLHDNACPHTAAATQDLIMTFDWEQFDHPPYSPDLAPSDFHVFLHLKPFLGGRWFHNENEVKEAVKTWFASQAASFYNAGIKKLVPQQWSKLCQKVVHINVNKNGLKINCFFFQQPIRTYFLDNPCKIGQGA
jgi:histone-lysine N-methyltransferase SETMAR